ncbi:MAG: DinB family protein [Candidatus Zixiibacteriota bacterium]
MFTTIEEFEKRWQYESSTTQAVMDALTDESLGQAVADDHRTLGRMAWHIACAIPEITGHTGIDFGGVDPRAPMPRKAREIADGYRKFSQTLLQDVKKNWTDSTLAEEDEMYGEKWRRGFTLLIVTLHEVHHRGQMTVLMRQAGLVVPNIYGQAKEGWAALGIPEPEV